MQQDFSSYLEFHLSFVPKFLALYIYICLFVQVLFLRNRANNSETATLLTSSGGVILAWSVHGGGLLGKFQASHVEGESVHGMVADSDHKLLITGDRMGYIAVSDLIFVKKVELI